MTLGGEERQLAKLRVMSSVDRWRAALIIVSSCSHQCQLCTADSRRSSGSFSIAQCSQQLRLLCPG